MSTTRGNSSVPLGAPRTALSTLKQAALRYKERSLILEPSPTPPLSIVSTRGTRSSHNGQHGLVVTHAADEGSARYLAGLRIQSAEWAPDGEVARVTTRPGPNGR